MKNTAVFVITYCIAMLFTYLWRWAMVGAILEGDNPDNLVTSVIIVLLINYIILCVIAYQRSKDTDKNYLVAFPIIAGFFDILLGFIPLIPSILNIVTIILGVQISCHTGIQCPVCKEWIQENASVCRFCHTVIADFYRKNSNLLGNDVVDRK